MMMFPINQFNIKMISETDTEGLFQIGPLPTGYGATLGNVYRRLLLTSIPGAAVTRIKLDGVQHEYTTLAGVKDDVLSIILALKGISVISHSEEPVLLALNIKGSKSQVIPVTADDIEKNSMIEIIEPEYVITTLADDKAEIKAEITIEKGIGYSKPNDDARTEIGTMPVDSVFTPVTMVSMNVKNTRVGQQTDLDLLELKVITNGAITPSAAIYKSAEIMMKLSEHLLDSADSLLSEKSQQQVENAVLPIKDEEVEVTEEREPLFVSDLNLSTRLTNALLNSNYEDLRQLEGLTEEEIAGIKGMGEKSYNELIDILATSGVTLI